MNSLNLRYILKRSFQLLIGILILTSFYSESPNLFPYALIASFGIYIYIVKYDYNERNCFSIFTNQKTGRDGEPICIAVFDSKLGHDFNYENSNKVLDLLNLQNSNPKIKYWIEKGKQI